MPQTLASTHPDYAAFEEDRVICRDLMGGTKRMRDRGEEYLPRETEEDPQDYQNRLRRSFLYNGFRRAVLNLVGRIFDNPVTVEGDARIEEWAEDVTNDGRDVVTFGRDIGHTAMSEGVAHIFIDFTQRAPVKNRAEEIALQPRPYMVEIRPEDLFFWEYEDGYNGRVLREIRFKERYVEEYAHYEQIRVYRSNGDWEIHRKGRVEGEGGARKGEWYVESYGNTGLSGIPLVTIYAGERIGMMGACPPLLDLAYVNIAHWQSSSDQRHVLHIARVPVLFTKGLKSPGGTPAKIVIGVNRHIRATDPNADAKYVEHSGRAIDSGRQDLQDLEAQMASLGIELLLPNQPGDLTATGRALTKKAEESTLLVIAKALRRGLIDAFYWMEQWAGISTPTEVGMDLDQDLVITDSGELQVLTAARERRDLSRPTWWREMQRRGILSEDFDPDLEAALLDEAGPDGLAEPEPPPAPVVVAIKDPNEEDVEE